MKSIGMDKEKAHSSKDSSRLPHSSGKVDPLFESSQGETQLKEQHFGDLKDNFEHQQAMIGQLKDMLKHKELAKKKEKEFDDYATRLAKMKPRLMRGRGRGRGQTREEPQINRSSQITPHLKSQNAPEVCQIEQGIEIDNQLEKEFTSMEDNEKKAHFAEKDESNPIVKEDKGIDLEKHEESRRETELEIISSNELPAGISGNPDSSQGTEIEIISSANLPAKMLENPDLSQVSEQPCSVSTGTNTRSKILLLRKQLEENRIKFERQQRENAEKCARMELMSDRIEKLGNEIHQRDTVIKSLKDSDTVLKLNLDTQQLYQQIIHKDNSILELSDKIIHLENFIQDQKEQLSEKDQIISSRTEAVMLVSKDKDEKLHKVSEDFEELKREIITIQNNFIHKEEKWKESEVSLENKIKESERKISILQENCQRVDSIRFELSARNAELQEKIISQQSDLKVLTVEKNKFKDQSENRSLEIDALKKKLVAAESFGQKKLKSLEKQIKTLSTSSDLGEKILDLQNNIAELEEEKGNLQLKMVDYDEVVALNNTLKESLSEAETKIENINTELISQMSLFNEKESDRIKIVEELNCKCLTVNELTETNEKAQKELNNMKQSIITLELKLCEVEEERDLALKAKRDSDNGEDSMLTDFSCENYKCLEDANAKLKSELDSKELSLKNLQMVFSDNEIIVKNALQAKEDKVTENECLVGFLAEKESLLLTQSHQIEGHDLVVKELKDCLSSKDKDIINLREQSKSLQLKIESLKSELEDNGCLIAKLNAEAEEFKENLASNRTAISLLKDSEMTLNELLREKENIMNNLNEENNDLKREISNNESNIREHLHRIGNLDNELHSKEKKILNLESEIADKVKESSQQGSLSMKYKQDLENLKQSHQQLVEKLEAECNVISTLLAEKENNVKHLQNELEIRSTQLSNSEIMVSKYEVEVCEINRLYDEALSDKNAMKIKVKEIEQKLEESTTKKETEVSDIGALHCLINEKEKCLQELNDLNEQLKISYTQIESRYEELSNEYSNLAAQLQTVKDENKALKTDYSTSIQTKDEELIQSRAVILEKDNEIRLLQDSKYDQSSKVLELQESLETINKEVIEKTEQITMLSDELEQKDKIIEELGFNCQSINQALAVKDSELTAHVSSIEYYKAQLEENNSLLYTLEQRKIALENEVKSLFNENEVKSADMSTVTVEVASQTAEIERYKLVVQEMQENLHKTQEELLESKNYFGSILQERDTLSVSLNEEICRLKDDVNKKEQEIAELQVFSNDIGNQLNSLKEIGSAFSPDNTTIVTTSANYESEINRLQQELNQQKMLNQQLQVEKDNLSPGIINYATESNSCATDCEISKLKKELEEAQQAIAHLETSLATQSVVAESLPQDNSEEWGVVDLGEKFVDPPSLSMQTSLYEKDKTLTVIQEQLKNALEEVNTTNNEKKILNYQMNTLEATLSHKDDAIASLQQQIVELQEDIQNLNAKIMEYQSCMNISKDNESDGLTSQTTHNQTTPTEQDSNAFASESDNVQAQSEHCTTKENENDATSHAALVELQYKLSWYEENWPALTEHYTLMQHNYQAAQEQIEVLTQDLNALKSSDAVLSHPTFEDSEVDHDLNSVKRSLEEKLNHIGVLEGQLEELRQQNVHLKEFEIQNVELQNQIQLLQHQCSILDQKVKENDECSVKIKDYEMLYGELQSSMQVAETKQEGSKSRVHELELMVQSAESEIVKLRSNLQEISKEGEVLVTERSSLRTELENLREEVRKNVSERERFEEANDRLQSEAASWHSRSVELQAIIEQSNNQINQLRSEIEVLEGENDRNRTNFEVLETELNNQRLENEVLIQNNQVALAERESLDSEMQRLNEANINMMSERGNLICEIQRLTEINVSTESEITRLKSQLQLMTDENGSLSSKLEEMRLSLQTSRNLELSVEEVDWTTEAKFEDEHMQMSSSIESSLKEEISELKATLISHEKAKNEAANELQATKLKNGKLIQKLKAANNKNENLQKTLDKMKSKSGHLSDLDLALEEEWKSQINMAESERDELKVKLDESEKEKEYFKGKVDVLQAAEERFIELKETQDASVRQLSSKNKNLESHIHSLEWKISELEESLEHNQESSLRPQSFNEDASDSKTELKHKIAKLEVKIEDLKAENVQLKKVNDDLKPKLDKLIEENDELRSILEDAQDAKSKTETNANTYKTSYLELYNEKENLQEEYDKIKKEFFKLETDQVTLKSAYDILYGDYHTLQEDRDSVRLEFGIIVGERDKLVEEIKSLNNQLKALQEEEEVEIIKALQSECAELREQNSQVKDELTCMAETLRQNEETIERTKNSLQQQVDIQDMLRTELISKSMENDNLTSANSKHENELKYLNAELASIRSKCSQLQQMSEEFETANKLLKSEIDDKKMILNQHMELAIDFPVKPGAVIDSQETRALGTITPNPDFEATLSSLHLHELRCQQLSMEINKLLEERDSLQLKLSSALRENQELTRELTLSHQLPSPLSPPQYLNQKLSELRDLNDSLEQRVLEELKSSNLSSANLSSLPTSLPTFISHTAPATPTATRQPNYGAAKENQSTSPTLLGWILGKSSPKEVLHV